MKHMIRRSNRAPMLALERLEDRSLFSISAASFDNLSFDFGQYDESRIVVGLQAGTTISQLSAVGANVVRYDTALDLGEQMFRLELQPGQTVNDALAFFQLVPAVRFAQADYQVELTAAPNDPLYSREWGLRTIDAPTAWNTTTGAAGTIVAVIDTGVDYNHPDLRANIWSNSDEIAGNGRDDDGNGYVDDIRGWDFYNNDNDPMDDNGHGTHVAGVIGAAGNNATGISGVNWRIQIMPLKFLNRYGSGSMSNAIRALNYAVNNGAAVSNNSYGGGGFYQAFYNAIANARARGHIFVAAAGNSSLNADARPQYPASYNLDNIVSVAATDSLDRLASFSNYGASSVDLGAPGVSIYSTLPNNRYGYMSGTSMASPFVAGAIAMVRELHPDWTYRQVIQQVLSTTDSLASLAGKTVSGGRLDLGRAIGAGGGSGETTGGPVVNSATFSGSTSGTFNKVRVTFDRAIDASTFTSADVVRLTRNGSAVSGLSFSVTRVADNQFDIGFATQTEAGSYQLTFGPDIRDSSGNLMDQSGNGTNGEEPADCYTANGAISGSFTFNSTDVPKTILDRRRTISVLNVDQDVTIDKLVVKLNISHTYDSDLRIYLKGPDGTTVLLFNRRGGAGDNVTATFDDNATVAIGSGRAPFLGTFRPEQVLTAFNTKNARGQWQLLVDDVAAYDTGRINSWSISIETGTGGASGRSLGAESTSDFVASLKAVPQMTQTVVVSAPYWSPAPARGVEETREEESIDVMLSLQSGTTLDCPDDSEDDSTVWTNSTSLQDLIDAEDGAEEDWISAMPQESDME